MGRRRPSLPSPLKKTLPIVARYRGTDRCKMGSSRKRFGRRIECVGSEGGGIHQLAKGYGRHRWRRGRTRSAAAQIDAHGARPAETPMEFWKSSCSSSIRKACSCTWRSAMIRFPRSRRPSCQHALIYPR